MNIYLLAVCLVIAPCAKSQLTTDLIRQIIVQDDPNASQKRMVAITPFNLSVPYNYMEVDSDAYNPALADYDVFDWALTKRLAATSEENFLLSPLGLKLALAILTEAATGSTQSELASVLGFDLDKDLIRKKFTGILESLQTKSSKYILNLGSRIYVGGSNEPRQRFAAIAQNYYKSEILKINFNEPEAADSINGWVSNITQGHIHSLVRSEDISGLAALVLTTLFFKGNWLHQFDPHSTVLSPFYVTANTTKEVPFMNIRNKFYYVEAPKLDAKILRMAYLGNKFAMYLVVPNTLTGLPRVFNNLKELRDATYLLQRRQVEVSMPKFKFDYNSALDGVLKEMGIRQAFEDTASFPGISRSNQLAHRIKVSKIIQQNGIETNELGSTVYSATEIELENKFGVDEMFYELVVNKPFLFFIQDEATKQLLFTGRVSDPSLIDGALKL